MQASRLARSDRIARTSDGQLARARRCSRPKRRNGQHLLAQMTVLNALELGGHVSARFKKSETPMTIARLV
jgi:hypothetical protein